MKFREITAGDFVTRNMGGALMDLRVTEVDEDFIYCGPKDKGWKFSRLTGFEVDEDLGWTAHMSGSRLVEGGSREPLTRH